MSTVGDQTFLYLPRSLSLLGAGGCIIKFAWKY